MYTRLTRDVRCPVCESNACREYGTIDDRVVYRCRRCRVRFVWPRPSLAELADLYGELYFSEIPEYVSPSDEYFHQIIDRHISRVVPCLSGLNVLDFGCGEGHLLVILQQMGAKVWGVEYNEAGRKTAGDKAGVPVFKTLDDIPPELVFDLVIMNEVLEHLLSPTVECGKLYSRIRKDGGCYVSTPNFEGLKAKLIGFHWEQYRNRTHLCYFDWYSLRYLGLSVGFTHFRRLPTRVRFSTMGFVRQTANTILSQLYLDSGLKGFFRK